MNSLTCRPDASGGYDFVIDGVFLNETIYGPPEKDSRYITLLRRSLLADAISGQLRRLRGEEPGEFIADRVWLYFCPVCFDEGCGGVSMRIGFTEASVRWTSFLHDSSDDPGDGWPIEPALDFEFDKSQYLAELARVEVALLSGARAVPIGNPEHRMLDLERLATRRWLRKKSKPRGPQWTIAGETLGRILAAADTGTLITDEEYSMLLAEGTDPAHLAAVMLGRVPDRDLPGRIPLLVGECLHRECGQITARLTRTDATVSWDDFRLQGPGEEGPGRALGRPVKLHFEARQYDSAIAGLNDYPS